MDSKSIRSIYLAEAHNYHKIIRRILDKRLYIKLRIRSVNKHDCLHVCHVFKAILFSLLYIPKSRRASASHHKLKPIPTLFPLFNSTCALHLWHSAFRWPHFRAALDPVARWPWRDECHISSSRRMLWWASSPDAKKHKNQVSRHLFFLDIFDYFISVLFPSDLFAERWGNQERV